MLSFLFWNLYGRQQQDLAARLANLQGSIARLATAHDLDVLMFVECESAPEGMTAALNSSGRGPYHCPTSTNERIRVFVRASGGALVDSFNSRSGRLTIRRFTPKGLPELLLAVVHFQDRQSWSAEGQTLEAVVLAQDVARAEDRAGHQRTILVGDLNMNPYHAGVVGAQALNAVMARALVRPVERVVAGRAYRCFYNPMWGYFGDRTPGPPGTLCFAGADPASHYWNIYDQVLLRPALMDSLVRLAVLEDDGQESFLTNAGRPRKASLSDHLPVLFQLAL